MVPPVPGGFLRLKRGRFLDRLKREKWWWPRWHSRFVWPGKERNLWPVRADKNFCRRPGFLIWPVWFFGERRARRESRGDRGSLGEGHVEEGRRRTGQEGNRNPPLLERGIGEDSWPKTREFRDISSRNPKLYPTHAKPNQGLKKLNPKINWQNKILFAI